MTLEKVKKIPIKRPYMRALSFTFTLLACGFIYEEAGLVTALGFGFLAYVVDAIAIQVYIIRLQLRRYL